MHFYPRSIHTRRRVIRLYAYAICMGIVLFSGICMQMHGTQSNAAARSRMCRAILSHMNEENDTLRRAIRDKDTASVLRHADTLCGYASLAGMISHSDVEERIASALADTAFFYSALAHAVQNENTQAATDFVFWQNGTEMISTHIADIALSLSDRQHPTQPTDAELAAADDLSAFSASFRTEPIRLTTPHSHEFRFDREPVISSAQARQTLRSLLGNTASFLGNSVTDDTHGCYVFSCQNGYAEVSRCGGHLLSYAFYPHGNVNTQGVLLSDSDLAELAASFLKKAGLPSSDLKAEEDRHGIRIFTVIVNDNKEITVGVRMHDGLIVQLQAESFYTVDAKSHP